jgi:class 3 adenylate cyclase
MVATTRAFLESDVSHVLPAIQAPTLVISRSGDRHVRPEHSAFLASHIPAARLLRLAGDDHFPYSSPTDGLLDEVEEFVTGARPAPVLDRELATVLFTDIVGSTERAAGLGDRAWRELLDRYDSVVRRQLDRFRGRLVKGTGDGTLATFDGPARAIQCAQTITGAVQELGLEVPAGLHTGEIERRGTDVAGIAVHLAQRVSAMARPGEVLVSRTVTDLVAGSGISFVDRGEHELKGVPGTWRLYLVDT